MARRLGGINFTHTSFLVVLYNILFGVSDGAPYTASKEVWKIGGLAIRGPTDFHARFSPTFSTYLTETVGPQFNPPIRFESIALDFSSTFTQVEQASVDFIYTNPSAFSCLESEFDVSAIVTLRNFRQGNELTRFGGIIFTRSDNDEINAIADLEGKIVEAVSISGLGAAQMQWKLLQDKGYSLMTLPKQVRFAFNQKKIVLDVLNGNADVGFVRTDMIEGMASKGEVNISSFKVIHQQNMTYEGRRFPFLSSTELYPEWSLGMLPHVGIDYMVSERVAFALMDIHKDHWAAKNGTYSTWQPPLSYMRLNEMQEDLNWIIKNETTGKRMCIRSSNLYDAIVCPDGYFKLSQDVVSSQCNSYGDPKYTCPTGYECICEPCRMADTVEVIGPKDGNQCQKMSLCAEIEQTEVGIFTLRDNLKRASNLTYKLHVLEEDSLVPREGVVFVDITSGGEHMYKIPIRTSVVGDNVIEFFIGGVQIPNSPVLIRVHRKSCDADFWADSSGECKRTRTTIYLPDWIHYMSYFLFSINVFLSIAFAAWTYLKKATKIVVAAQPAFLYIVPCGCIMSSSTIITVAFDDRQVSDFVMDQLCQLNIWLYGIGFALSYTSLFAKTYRAKCLMLDNLTSKRQDVKIAVSRYMQYIVYALLIEIIIIGIWTIVSPLQWTRRCAGDSSGFCESIGRCASEHGLLFAAILGSVHVIMLMFVLRLCYEVRNIPAEFAEHKWITASTISSIEILCLAPVLVGITWDNPAASTMIALLAIFFNDLGILLMIFIPKMSMFWEVHTQRSQTTEDILFNLRRDVRKIIDADKKAPRTNFLTASKRRASKDASRNMTVLTGDSTNEVKKLKEEIRYLKSQIRISTSFIKRSGSDVRGKEVSREVREVSSVGSSVLDKELIFSHRRGSSRFQGDISLGSGKVGSSAGQPNLCVTPRNLKSPASDNGLVIPPNERI
ncbi:hypothetical protein AAMO2058_000965100 [Amorphochlora amoebiformis]|uniref:G-protein coupled receptors family 3 profile domain-containing protein n=1 Tax=Amorphochlora amoebiformis TaxID=1561963 RepID=A0A7S0DIN8_9EUKA|mmetsp:Transcript_29771/g.47582  ORF Transcript_29771/g.47582 Transcript_29771/m.47582 type:complete len:950 (+) Transcript_29771:689-3538(+)